MGYYREPGVFIGWQIRSPRLVGLIFFVIGLVFVAVGGVLFLVSGVLQSQSYVEGKCTISSKQLLTSSSRHKNSRGYYETVYTYAPSLTYVVHAADGRDYQGNRYTFLTTYTSDRAGQQAILDGYQINSQYACWYDPSSPSSVVLQKDTGASWMLIGAFLGFGGLFTLLGLVLFSGILALLPGTMGLRY